jgi:hypothetical protein
MSGCFGVECLLMDMVGKKWGKMGFTTLYSRL